MPNIDILPDVLLPNLKLVICGTAVAEHSARVSSYYAGENNMFWKILHETGLTDHLLKASEYSKLLNHGIGLTDLAKKATGVDAKIRHEDYDLDTFMQKMNTYRPKVLCFNGKAAAALLYSYEYKKKWPTAKVRYGAYPCLFNHNETLIFVAPSTSGAARRYWQPEYWHKLAMIVEKIAQGDHPNYYNGMWPNEDTTLDRLLEGMEKRRMEREQQTEASEKKLD